MRFSSLLEALLFCWAFLYLFVHYWSRFVKWWADAHGIDTSKWED